MKKIIAIIFFTYALFASANTFWYSYSNEDMGAIGFKDKNGVIKIKPKFMGLTSVRKFEKIIAVMEDNNGSFDSYYLTKAGKIVQRDNLYSFDMSYDCEKEGFIRYRDSNGKGLLNDDGEVVISSQYNRLSQVHNGLLTTLCGATIERHGEHYSWIGGEEALIDINNTILINNFKRDDDLNMYSLEISEKPSKDKIRDSFKGVNGRYYSFINYKKELKSWFFEIFMKSLKQEDLVKHTYDEVTYWIEEWESIPKDEFYKRNYKILENRLSQVEEKKGESKEESTAYQIMMDDLNPLIYNSSKYEKYFDNCSNAKRKYPVLNVVISHKIKDDSFQDHFDFLRTEDGYKLIQVSIRRYELK